MNKVKEIIPYAVMAVLGIITLYFCFEFLKDKESVTKEVSRIVRIIVALAAASISIALPGILEIGTDAAQVSKTTPKVKASGALAVFVLVYLFDPISL